MRAAQGFLVSSQPDSGDTRLPFHLAMLCLVLCGCASMHNEVSKAESDGSLAWLQSLFPGKTLPVSARNVHAYSRHYPGTSILYGRLDARTEELDRVLAHTDGLPNYRQLFALTDCQEKRYMTAQTGVLKDCPWWTPGEANRFGSATIVKHWRDRLGHETRIRKFYQTTTYYAAINDSGNGNGTLFILVAVLEPEQEE